MGKDGETQNSSKCCPDLGLMRGRAPGNNGALWSVSFIFAPGSI